MEEEEGLEVVGHGGRVWVMEEEEGLEVVGYGGRVWVMEEEKGLEVVGYGGWVWVMEEEEGLEVVGYGGRVWVMKEEEGLEVVGYGGRVWVMEEEEGLGVFDYGGRVWVTEEEGELEVVGYGGWVYGLYKFVVMPFGLCNAPGTFQHAMIRIFHDYLDTFVIVYLDDILIFSKTVEERVAHLDEVLSLLRQHKFKINGEKCEFGRTRVLYLGHEISAEGSKSDDGKVANIHDWPHPQSVTEVKSFLVTTGYYRNFVENYSIVAAPLTDLTRLDTPWKWTERCEAAFRHLKHALTHYEVLKLPDLDKPFIVTTDASQYGALMTEFNLAGNVTQYLVEAYREDLLMSEIIRSLEAKDKVTSAEFELVNDLLFLEKAGNKRLCVPNGESLCSLFLGECHDATGHFGYKKTAANLLQRFWWPTMMRDAQLYVETCQVCQRDKPHTQAPLGLLKPLPIPEQPGESLSMDFMDTLVTSKSGMRHIFVIVDRFSKYARLVAMPETASTEYVIRMFKENWVRDFGLPKSIISDRDVRFTSELWKAAVAEQGTQLQMTSGNHPEANGQAEQLNRACHVSSATSATVLRQQHCHVSNSAMSATVPRQQCHVTSTTPAVPRQQQCPTTMTVSVLGMPGQLAKEPIAEYRQRFQAQLAPIEAEEQRQAAAEAACLQAEAAAAAEKQRLQAEADADTQARRKEAQDLLQRHEAASIEKLKFWHFEPSEHHEDATPEEQYKEFLAKLVTRLVYTCNHLQSELANLQQAVRNHKDLHEDATRALDSRVQDLEQVAPRPDVGESISAPSTRQLEERLDHVVAMLGDISTFAAPATISKQLDTLKTEVQQLHQLPNKDGNTSAQHYKMPTFRIEKFDDYTHQDPVPWWEGFTTELRILFVPEHSYIGALFLNSKGGCQIWLNHLATIHGVQVADLHKKISWDELTKLWKKRFIVDDALALTINRLFSMTQGNTPTRDWLTEWQKIVATRDLELPFSHLRRKLYNRSCAALSLALGDREQYTTFAEIIDKAREIIKTNRAAAHEKSAWQPTYVEKGKFGPRPQHVAAVQPDNIVEDPAATQASREGDQVAADQPRSNNNSRGKGKAKTTSPAGNGQSTPWVKFHLTEAEYKWRSRYVRLELLEGVVAFYAGDLESARRILSSAKDKFHQLQVSNEALVTLLSMGITSREARRSLRVSGQDPCRAAQFVFEQRQKMAEKVEEDRRLWRERREQKSYGKTPTGKAVDLAKLAEIESLGYPRALAAEALRQADNERAKALDILLNPDLLVALEVAICKKKGKKRSREHVDEVSLAILVSQGFSRSEAKSALRETEGDVEAALAGLVSKATDASSTAATGGPSGEGTCGSEAGGAGEASQTRDGEAVREEDFLSADEDDEGTMNEVRDVGMEDEIARDISGDPFSEYDVDMAEEGKAIEEYLALVESSCTSARGNLHAPSS
ncbi:hypothetical protein CBR_g57083 [Chara braunii]|uniref:Integrase catalytic domain-containing protein n=1 Tax=Chara braunii TaxID=69332 RepID=A0A388K818_CHABU|nr:hypothetical protein CBR_g57083 [Chara braunii]|eukprot:GBG66204.1 hypothetical protein CBR_g57083 [Chara braunii]